MARTLKQIYDELSEEKNNSLGLSKITSKSSASVINSLLWVVASGIRVLETIVDVSAVDISNTINNRINGTPAYYAQALKQYQHGDEISIQDNGLRFGYSNIDESKRIISNVSFSEIVTDINKDNRILYKIATGTVGNWRPLDEEQMVSIRAYLNKIKFAGTNIDVVSKKGDILLPYVTVYYDGQLDESVMMEAVTKSLHEYINSLDFDATVKKLEVLEAIKSTKHVTDAYIDKSNDGGIFIYSYNDSGEIESEPSEVDRIIQLPSGYLTESSKLESEVSIPNFKECLTFKVDK